MKTVLTFIFGLTVIFCSGHSITVLGPVEVCPGIEYQYSASARDEFGNVIQGCFGFEFYLNGVLKSVVGAGGCPCVGQQTSYSVNYAFDGTGSYEVRARFGNRFAVCYESTKSLYGTSRLVYPQMFNDSNGALSFCTPGQSRVISMPTIVGQSKDNCYWHHKFDYIVPTGWTVRPATGDTYVTIPNGISTPATSVTVTAQSSALLAGFSGNYVMTVRTSDYTTPGGKSYSKSISRKIWIGTYGNSIQFSGTAAVCKGSIYTYSVLTPDGMMPPPLTWTYPSGWQQNAKQSNFITLYVPTTTSTYGPVTAYFNNGCGAQQAGMTTFPGYSCPSYGYSITAFPNPTDDELNVEFVATSSDAETPEPTVQQVQLLNSSGAVVRTSTSSTPITFDTKGLPKGQYFLHVFLKDEVIKEQIFLK